MSMPRPAVPQAEGAGARASGDGDGRMVVQLDFAADSAATRDALQALRAALSRQGTDPALLSRVEMVLAEVFNNVAEHAYAERPGGPVRLTLRQAGAGLVATVSDRGAPMPGNRLPEARLPRADVPMPNLPEGGFGWYLIHTESDSLIYRRENGENHLRLRFAPRQGG